jgi:hypothetical protein
VLHNKRVCIRDIRYVILSTLFPSFMSNQACSHRMVKTVPSHPYMYVVAGSEDRARFLGGPD